MTRATPLTVPSDAVVLLGVPSDAHSSFMPGPAKAPPLIREALHSPAGNLWSEYDLDLADHPQLVDGGDLPLQGEDGDFEQITQAVDAYLAQGARVLTLGGDHAITYPILRAYAQHYERITILQIDAHPDLYPDFEGDPLSHASVFARIMEADLAEWLIQVGIRTMNGVQRAQTERFNVDVIAMYEFDPGIVDTVTAPLYLSLDLDGLDPAFAPGVNHPESGGLTTRQVIDLIHRIRAPLVGADIVEYSPDRDLNGLTAKVAAKFVKEIASAMMG